MKLFWLDFESTGLDPHKDKPLEIAVSVADFYDPFNATPVYQAVMPLAPWLPSDLRPVVQEMHTKSGLLIDCASWQAKQVDQVEDELLRIVPVCPRDVMPVLGGSSIRFDWHFMQVHMPRLAARFEFRENDVRTYDVSELKRFCQSWGMPKLEKKIEAHRAASDILESIDHGKQCLEWLRTTGAGAMR